MNEESRIAKNMLDAGFIYDENGEGISPEDIDPTVLLRREREFQKEMRYERRCEEQPWY